MVDIRLCINNTVPGLTLSGIVSLILLVLLFLPVHENTALTA